MKVVMVVEAFGAGVLNAVILASKAVLDFGGNVVVIHDMRPDTPPNVYDMFPSGVEFVRFPIKKSLFLGGFGRGYLDFHKLILKLNPDVLHMHSSYAGALGRVTCLVGGVRAKTFYSPHAFKFVGEKGIAKLGYFLMEKLLGKVPAAVVACSNSELLAARRVSGRSLLLENSVDVQRLPEKEYTSGRCVIGSVGRLAPQKAPEKFAKILSAMATTHDIEGVWVGGGDQKYVKVLEECGVRHVPQVKPYQLFQIFSKIDVYIQTSLYEGMPLSVIEAQVMGIPCVVSNVDGNRDVIEHGVTGFVANSAEEMLAYTKKLVENYDMRVAFGRAARERGLRRFSYQRYRDELYNIYQPPAVR